MPGHGEVVRVYKGGACSNCTCDLGATVVVPCFNAGDLLREQLEALAGQDTPELWELVLSDNGSTDGSLAKAQELAPKFHRISIIDSSGRAGASYARNAGAKAARSTNLLFCDADDLVSPFWVHELVRALRHHSFVGGRLDVDLLNTGASTDLRGGTPQVGSLPTFWGRVLYVMTANMGVRQDLFEAVGGFDDVLFQGAAAEDVDFAIRVAKLGISPEFVPGAVVHYRHRTSREAALRQARAYGDNAAKIFIAHDELPSPTVRDDFMAYAQSVRDALRAKLLRRSAAFSWQLRDNTARTARLARSRQYWSLARRYPQPKPGIAVARGQALRKALMKVAERVQLPRPRPDQEDLAYSTLWWAQQNLDPPHRHLLGLGLLDDASVTLEMRRGANCWYTHAAADAVVHGIVETGGYSRLELDRVVRFVRGLRQKSEIAINVGANIGTTAIPLASAGFRVLAIEPAPRALELLRRNIDANGLSDRVEVVGSALSNEPGAVEMVVGANLSISEILGANDPGRLAADSHARVVRVKGERLDDILRERNVDASAVCFVWSDTEGSEASVIATGRSLWASGVPLWVEIRPYALIGHIRITDFCALVMQHFTAYRTIDELSGDASRSTDTLRDFIDDLGRDRWTFTNVMLHS